MPPNTIAAPAPPQPVRSASPGGSLGGNAVALGDFAVAPDGGLSERWPGTRPALRFRWKGLPCAATLVAGKLELRADAGRVPSTLHRDARRAGVLDALRALPDALPPGWQVFLEADHRVGLGTTAPIASPATAPVLLTALVRFALAFEPYRERLAAAGLDGAPSAPGGTAST